MSWLKVVIWVIWRWWSESSLNLLHQIVGAKNTCQVSLDHLHLGAKDSGCDLILILHLGLQICFGGFPFKLHPLPDTTLYLNLKWQLINCQATWTWNLELLQIWVYFQRTITQAWNDFFPKFQSLELIVCFALSFRGGKKVIPTLKIYQWN